MQVWEVSSQNLLASILVDSGDTLLNGFHFADLSSSVFLNSGSDYLLGALYANDDGDSYVSSPSSVTANHITILNGVYATSGSLGLVYPQGDSSNLARIGPNMIATITQVPGPETLGLIGLSLLAMRRFRK